jgi:soluble lytic murein transglycosylase-like protein
VVDLASLLTGGAAGRADSVSGLRPEFVSAFQAMIAAAPPEVQQSFRISSAYRSPQLQQVLWNRAVAKYGSAAAARKWVAPPGRSQHGFGNAMDLQYASPAARAWAHANAGRFGLAFPLANEPWHIELASARRGGGQGGYAPPALQAPMEQAFGTQWDNSFNQYGRQYGVNPALLFAMAQKESTLNPNAVSPAGAVGLMQFMPGTAERFKIDPRDPNQSIKGAAEYMQFLTQRYHGNLQHALAAYNWGEGNVDKWLKWGQGRMEALPSETRNYVNALSKFSAPQPGLSSPPVPAVPLTVSPPATAPSMFSTDMAGAAGGGLAGALTGGGYDENQAMQDFIDQGRDQKAMEMLSFDLPILAHGPTPTSGLPAIGSLADLLGTG